MTLLQRFTLLGILVTAILAIIFGMILNQQVRESALDEAAREADLIASALITPNVSTEDFSEPTTASVAAWEQHIGQVAGKFDIDQIKVWNLDGVVVYSNDASIIGQQFAISPELQGAYKGEISSELAKLDHHGGSSGTEDFQTIEVYVPVIPEGSSEVVGVYELYRSYTPTQTALQRAHRIVWAGSFIGFGLLFTSLYVLVRSASRQLQYMAYHDPLTGLANRRLLNERAGRALQNGQRRAQRVTLLYLDLTRFKAVNDSLGHSIGDQILVQVAERLRPQQPDNGLLARIGGDEFAMLLTDSSEQQTASVASRLLDALQNPFQVPGQSVQIGAEIGIARVPDDATNWDQLLNHADIAMYQARARGTQVQVYGDKKGTGMRD